MEKSMEQHGLTLDLFTLYSSAKCSSHIHNLARMRAKDALLAVCEPAHQALVAHAELHVLRETSSEIPNISNQNKVQSQWVTWSRNEEQRYALRQFLDKTHLSEGSIFQMAAQDKHMNLCVTISDKGLFVGVHCSPLATVDRKNLAQKLTLSWEREHLLTCVQDMPADMCLFFGEESWVLSQIEDAWWLQLAERLTQDTDKVLRIGQHLTPQQVLNMQNVSAHLQECLLALVPWYRFAAWSHTNDLIQAQKKIQEDKKKERQSTAAPGLKKGVKVRIDAGDFRGQVGLVTAITHKNQVKVQLDRWALSLPMKDVVVLSDPTAQK
jgi:hypothetical protein